MSDYDKARLPVKGLGVYDATNNMDPNSSGLIAHERNVTADDTYLNQRLTGKPNAAGDTRSLDVSMHDGDGEAISVTNPLPVYPVTDAPGTELHHFEKETAVAAGASSTHTYSVANGVTFSLMQVLAAGSGKIKVELEIGDGALSETFAYKAVWFTSVANPIVDTEFAKAIKVVGTANTTTVKLTLTNKDNQPQDIYSTLVGTYI